VWKDNGGITLKTPAYIGSERRKKNAGGSKERRGGNESLGSSRKRNRTRADDLRVRRATSNSGPAAHRKISSKREKCSSRELTYRRVSVEEARS